MHGGHIDFHGNEGFLDPQVDEVGGDSPNTASRRSRFRLYADFPRAQGTSPIGGQGIVADRLALGNADGTFGSDAGRAREDAHGDRLGEVGVPEDLDLDVLRTAPDDGVDRLVKLDLEGDGIDDRNREAGELGVIVGAVVGRAVDEGNVVLEAPRDLDFLLGVFVDEAQVHEGLPQGGVLGGAQRMGVLVKAPLTGGASMVTPAGRLRANISRSPLKLLRLTLRAVAT